MSAVAPRTLGALALAVVLLASASLHTAGAQEGAASGPGTPVTLEAPLLLIGEPGGERTATVRVVNDADREVTVRVTAWVNRTPEWGVTPKSRDVTLPPQTRASLEFTVRVPDHASAAGGVTFNATEEGHFLTRAHMVTFARSVSAPGDFSLEAWSQPNGTLGVNLRNHENAPQQIQVTRWALRGAAAAFRWDPASFATVPAQGNVTLTARLDPPRSAWSEDALVLLEARGDGAGAAFALLDRDGNAEPFDAWATGPGPTPPPPGAAAASREEPPLADASPANASVNRSALNATFARLGVSPGAVAVGAGAAVAGAAVVAHRSGRLERVLPAPLLGLYTRIARSQSLDHGTRRRLHALVERRPGITLKELRRETGVASGTVRHHMRTLERHGLVTSWADGRLRRYRTHAADPLAVADLVTPAQERILALLEAGSLTQRHVAERLGITKQAVSHHLRNLERRGFVRVEREGATWRYRRVAREAAAGSSAPAATETHK